MRLSNEPQRALGDALRELRDERGSTQRAVAEAAKISAAHYCAIERGHANPMWGTTKRIARALDVSHAELSSRAAAHE